MQQVSNEQFANEMKIFEGLCNKALASLDACINNTNDQNEINKLTNKKYNFEKFVDYILNKTEFINAPASTRYHLCIPHGLLIHSNSVTRTMIKFNNALNENIPLYKIIFIGLFHDLGKHDDYEINEGNNKYYVPYNFSQDVYCEHEDQSVYLLMKYDLLDLEDFVAIVSHNSPWDGVTKCAFKKNKLMTLLQFADYYSTVYLEDRID